jgi:AcrR family transcriptional regulator
MAISATSRETAAKLTREERFAQQRQTLINAAAEVIGEVGYRDASITRISDRAQIAYGTFYRHFETQQDMFDTVLPEKGREIQRFVRQQVAGISDPVEMERAGLLAFQSFIIDNPGFFRLYAEGRVMAPEAHARHIANLLRAYVTSLLRWRNAGYFQALDDEGIRAVSKILIGARDYLFMECWSPDTAISELPQAAVDAYLDLVRGVV